MYLKKNLLQRDFINNSNMSFKLYVGNYPCYFSKNDIQSLFRNFEGVKFEKMYNWSKRKSFAFITCDDIETVVSVIKKINCSIVFGRKLIVRATDKGLQDYVDLILQYESVSEKCEKDDIETANVRQKFENQVDSSFPKNEDYLKDCENYTASEYSYKATQDKKSVVWVNVKNFPPDTTYKEFCDLFSNFHPIKIQKIPYELQGDKNIPEALVCFSSKDIAYDVIMELDNTYYKQRQIFVTNNDLTMLSDLYKIRNS